MIKIYKDNFLFNLIAPIYGLFYKSQKKNYYQTIEKVRDNLNVSEYSNIIDFGCGTGALCSVLSQEGLEVTGIDPAQRMLNIGAKKPENKSIEFVNCSNCSIIPFPDNSFELSIASYVAHGLQKEERIQMYKEMSRLTKCFVIIHDYNEKRRLFTDIIEFFEGGDYFNFIKNVKVELSEHFKSVRVFDVKKHVAWYICEPYKKED